MIQSTSLVKSLNYRKACVCMTEKLNDSLPGPPQVGLHMHKKVVFMLFCLKSLLKLLLVMHQNFNSL